MLRVQLGRVVPPKRRLERGEAFELEVVVCNESFLPVAAGPGASLVPALCAGPLAAPLLGRPLLHACVAPPKPKRVKGTPPPPPPPPPDRPPPKGGFALPAGGQPLRLRLCVAAGCTGVHYGGAKAHTKECCWRLSSPLVLRLDVVGGLARALPLLVRLFVAPVEPESDVEDAEGWRIVEEDNVSLRVRERPRRAAECTGAVVWDNALLLVRLLARRGKAGLLGRRVVDVGCGTGLLGLACAARGARAVLTDVGPAVPLSEANVRANAAAVRGAGGSASVVEHLWGESLDAVQAALGAPHADVLLACEIVYDNASFAPLLATLLALSGPKTELLLAVRPRHNCHVAGFVDMVRGSFELQPLEADADATALDASTSRVKHAVQLYGGRLLTP